MPLYECVFIARQDISSNQVEGLVSQLSSIIEEGGGRVAKTEMWGLRNLAYRINKNRKGHYALLNLDAPAAAVHEMERSMRINEDVLRYLTIRVEEIEEGPSIIMQFKHGRDDRGGRGGRGGFRGDRGDRGDRGGGHSRHGGGPRASGDARGDGGQKDQTDSGSGVKEDKPPKESAETTAEAKPAENTDAAPEATPEAKKGEKEAGE